MPSERRARRGPSLSYDTPDPDASLPVLFWLHGGQTRNGHGAAPGALSGPATRGRGAGAACACEGDRGRDARRADIRPQSALGRAGGRR